MNLLVLDMKTDLVLNKISRECVKTFLLSGYFKTITDILKQSKTKRIQR